ncbi:DUF4145 domain-containing protein [Ruminococcus sp.]|uniref:DUF4145 domain-containing protein n=1 Tax=Ruminococcus sp. TaxID=41978 RepID=UPI0025FDAA76|nr:DUF4145 domain-containing protein [Ruminococcus sp.]
MKNYLSKYAIKYNNSEHIPSTPFTCGYCKNLIAPDLGYRISSSGQAGNQITRALIYMCPYCKNPSIYYLDEKEVVPGSFFGREVKGLPENIQTLYDECRINYSNKCYTSSQMIARTLLMHIAVEQGAKEGETFAKYIDYLNTSGFIPPNGKKWVDFIRKSGNVANHEIIIKEKEETEKVITFLSSLLLFIYELPNEMSVDEKS